MCKKIHVDYVLPLMPDEGYFVSPIYYYPIFPPLLYPSLPFLRGGPGCWPETSTLTPSTLLFPLFFKVLFCFPEAPRHTPFYLFFSLLLLLVSEMYYFSSPRLPTLLPARWYFFSLGFLQYVCSRIPLPCIDWTGGFLSLLFRRVL